MLVQALHFLMSDIEIVDCFCIIRAARARMVDSPLAMVLSSSKPQRTSKFARIDNKFGKCHFSPTLTLPLSRDHDHDLGHNYSDHRDRLYLYYHRLFF